MFFELKNQNRFIFLADKLSAGGCCLGCSCPVWYPDNGLRPFRLVSSGQAVRCLRRSVLVGRLCLFVLSVPVPGVHPGFLGPVGVLCAGVPEGVGTVGSAGVGCRYRCLPVV